jgi:hypothetical protein
VGVTVGVRVIVIDGVIDGVTEGVTVGVTNGDSDNVVNKLLSDPETVNPLYSTVILSPLV